MTVEIWEFLIQNSTAVLMAGFAFLSMCFAGIQVYFLYRTLLVAEKFESQHQRKLQIEREYLFAENALRILKEIDREMNALFGTEILKSPNLAEKIQEINSKTDFYTLHGFPNIKTYYLRWLAFISNEPECWKKIIKLGDDLQFYVGYFGSRELSNKKARLMFSAKDLCDWMKNTFPKLVDQEFDSVEKYINHFNENILPKYPNTMYENTPFVVRYENYRDFLTERLYEILKGERSSQK